MSEVHKTHTLVTNLRRIPRNAGAWVPCLQLTQDEANNAHPFTVEAVWMQASAFDPDNRNDGAPGTAHYLRRAWLSLLTLRPPRRHRPSPLAAQAAGVALQFINTLETPATLDPDDKPVKARTGRIIEGNPRFNHHLEIWNNYGVAQVVLRPQSSLGETVHEHRQRNRPLTISTLQLLGTAAFLTSQVVERSRLDEITPVAATHVDYNDYNLAA